MIHRHSRQSAYLLNILACTWEKTIFEMHNQCDTRPMVTILALEHHHPSDKTELNLLHGRDTYARVACHFTQQNQTRQQQIASPAF